MWTITSLDSKHVVGLNKSNEIRDNVETIGKVALDKLDTERLQIPVIELYIKTLEKQLEEIDTSPCNRNLRAEKINLIKQFRSDVASLSDKRQDDSIKSMVTVFENIEQDASEVHSMQTLANQDVVTQASLPVRSSVVTKSNSEQKKIVEEFSHLCGSSQHVSNVRNEATCDDCQSSVLFDSLKSTLVCHNCGLISSFVDSITSAKAFGEDVDLQIFAYRRVGHCRERLTLIQAKETARVPPLVIHTVKECLYALGCRTAASVTIVHIRKALKKIFENKEAYPKLKNLDTRCYYRNSMRILCEVTGRKPPSLTKTQERKFLELFSEMQAPFDRLKSNRSNFLSYSSVMRRLCELQGLHSFKQHFPMLRGSEKLADQNELFKKIALSLNWPLDKFDFTTQ